MESNRKPHYSKAQTNINTNQNTIGNSNVNIYSQPSTKEKSKSKDKAKDKEIERNTNRQLQEIRRLLKSFDFAIEKYTEFKNGMKEIEQLKKRAERELKIHYQYKDSKLLTAQEDGIVSDYKLIFSKEKSLKEKL